MSHVSASAAIYHPRADEMSLTVSTNPGSDALYLTVSYGHVWFAVGTGDDLEAEATAMERLAELAVEAAARLRARAADRSGEVAA